MQSGSPSFGTPESGIGVLCTGQIARHFGLPWRGGGGAERVADGRRPGGLRVADDDAADVPGRHQLRHALRRAGWRAGWSPATRSSSSTSSCCASCATSSRRWRSTRPRWPSTPTPRSAPAGTSWAPPTRSSASASASTGRCCPRRRTSTAGPRRARATPRPAPARSGARRLRTTSSRRSTRRSTRSSGSSWSPAHRAGRLTTDLHWPHPPGRRGDISRARLVADNGWEGAMRARMLVRRVRWRAASLVIGTGVLRRAAGAPAPMQVAPAPRVPHGDKAVGQVAATASVAGAVVLEPRDNARPAAVHRPGQRPQLADVRPVPGAGRVRAAVRTDRRRRSARALAAAGPGPARHLRGRQRHAGQLQRVGANRSGRLPHRPGELPAVQRHRSAGRRPRR